MRTDLLRLEESWPIVLGEELIYEIKTAILWDVTPCNLVDTYQRLAGTCCLLLHVSLHLVLTSTYRKLKKKGKFTIARGGVAVLYLKLWG
jgi:hypothetical protein